MRRYEKGQETKLIRVVCNRCGKELKVENGQLKEECVSVNHFYGYFSRKDGVTQHFDLCEDCLDELTAEFEVPADETEEIEIF